MRAPMLKALFLSWPDDVKKKTREQTGKVAHNLATHKGGVTPQRGLGKTKRGVVKPRGVW